VVDMRIEDFPKYYVGVCPHYMFLKEYFQSIDVTELQNHLNKGNEIKLPKDIANLDGIFLNEAMTFLRMSVINLLGYKFLMSGSYLAWGYVTLYYSMFYAVNCLLRLAGFAIVHIEDLQSDKIIRFLIRRSSDGKVYHMGGVKKSEHKVIWNNFASIYKWIDSDTCREIIWERITWNYDLLFPSQSQEKHAKKEARIMAEYNFLDPNFSNFPDPNVAESLSDLQMNYGNVEISAGELIKQCIKLITEIGLKSHYREKYLIFFRGLLDHVDDFQTKIEFRDIVKNWIKEAIDKLEMR